MLINMVFIYFDKEKKGMRMFVYIRNFIGKNKLGVCDFLFKIFFVFEFFLKILFI